MEDVTEPEVSGPPSARYVAWVIDRGKLAGAAHFDVQLVRRCDRETILSTFLTHTDEKEAERLAVLFESLGIEVVRERDAYEDAVAPRPSSRRAAQKVKAPDHEPVGLSLFTGEEPF